MKATKTAATLAALAMGAWIGSAGAAELRAERLAQAGSGSAMGSGSTMGSGTGARSGASGDTHIDPNTGMRSGADSAARAGATDEDPRSAARRQQGADMGTSSGAQRGVGSATGSPNTDTPGSGSHAPYSGH